MVASAAAAAVVCDNVAEPTGQRADGRIKDNAGPVDGEMGGE